MAISSQIDLAPAQEWPQGDARDPLGVWGARLGITGDATSGSIKVAIDVPSDIRGAHVYACYSVNFAQLSGVVTARNVKVRLLTNFPNVDPLAGIQGYATLRIVNTATLDSVTSPILGIGGAAAAGIQPLDRFILLRTGTGTPLTIVEMEFGENLNLATYSFEAYGYYWDRQVMQAPDGPRHPGSN